MDNITKKRMDKLLKLLALAGSPNEHEAKLAADKAKILMKKWDIRTVDVQTDRNNVDYIKVHTIDAYGKYLNKTEAALLSVLKECFDAEIIVLKNPDKNWTIHILSSEQEALIVYELFKKLRRKIHQYSKLFVQDKRCNGGKKRKIRASYEYGMVLGVHSKLSDIYGTPNKEEFALVAVKKNDIENKLKDMFGNYTKEQRGSTAPKDLDLHAYAQGFVKGTVIDINEPLTV